MAVHIAELSALSERCRGIGGGGLAEFVGDDVVRSLDWPEDVVEQWLYDFASLAPFQVGYGDLDLTTVAWRDELVPASEFLEMSTGPTDQGLIEEFAGNPDHWSEVRKHLGVSQHWESHGTWLRRPLLIDRALLHTGGIGLQVIEGRTRVGVLRGFMARGRPVAPNHAAWVARRRMM
ncbi:MULTISPECIES: hypothetical protein [unclassified Aeromicrobium]|uniref:hypothetical protein n=1 Tax=unclassified Aeromicrobium TaxID=2633570 RepID=UPI00288A63C1|nr:MULTISPECIES: hypothetical protein [unclassified Aeromicrobium]